MSRADQTILRLAKEYSLVEGNRDDYYKLHGTWCLTKSGAQKIAEKEGITMTVGHCDITPVSIAYRASFTKANGTSVDEIGSCRWDSGKNNPEATHAPEMAWKRCNVRGILAMVAPASGVYGAAEMTADWKANGGNANGSFSPQPQQEAAAPAPQAQQPTRQKEDWENTIASDFYSQASQLAAAMGAPDYQGFVKELYLHCSKFEGDNGWVTPNSRDYPSIKELCNKLNKDGKPGWAVSTLKKAEEVCQIVAMGTPVELIAPMWDSDQRKVILKHLTLNPAGGYSEEAASMATGAMPNPHDEPASIDGVPF